MADVGDDAPQRLRESSSLALDPTAATTDPNLPGFLARPPGAPAYHGFRILDDIEIAGFKLGMISDWEANPNLSDGDAFVVAPDDSRCGLNWYVTATPIFREVLAVNEQRWGVWDVAFPHAMTSHDNARRNLAAVLPQLKDVWLAWRKPSLHRRLAHLARRIFPG